MIAAAEWLTHIEREYCKTFIHDGGSAVKFSVVKSEEQADRLRESLNFLAKDNGFLRIEIDSANTRLHLIQDVFFAIARQLDWADLAQKFIEDLFRRDQYEWPKKGRTMTIEELADANGIDKTLFRREFHQALTQDVMRDFAMAHDFRVAMLQLLLSRTFPDNGDAPVTPPVVEWLRGELRTLAPVRNAQIFTKITRHNARAMLRSLCHWVRLTGSRGILLDVDLRRVTRPVPAGTEGIRYTTAAVLDAWEVLRQIVDEADSLEGILVVFIADEDFIGGDRKRSVDAYTALKMRIWDDVRDRKQDNPLAPLVVLAERGDHAI